MAFSFHPKLRENDSWLGRVRSCHVHGLRNVYKWLFSNISDLSVPGHLSAWCSPPGPGCVGTRSSLLREGDLPWGLLRFLSKDTKSVTTPDKVSCLAPFFPLFFWGKKERKERPILCGQI